MRDEPCVGSLSLLQSPNMADRFELEAITRHMSLNYPEALTVLADSMHINTQFIFITDVSDRPSLEMDTKRISIDGLLLSAAGVWTARTLSSWGSRIYLLATKLTLRLALEPSRVRAR